MVEYVEQLYNAPRGIGLRGFVWPEANVVLYMLRRLVRVILWYWLVIVRDAWRRAVGEGGVRLKDHTFVWHLVHPIPCQSKKKLQLLLAFVTMTKNRKDPVTNGGQEEEDQKHQLYTIKKGQGSDTAAAFRLMFFLSSSSRSCSAVVIKVKMSCTATKNS